VIKVHSYKCEKQEKTITVLRKSKRRKKKNTFSLYSAFVKKIINLEKSRIIIVLICFVVSTKM